MCFLPGGHRAVRAVRAVTDVRVVKALRAVRAVKAVTAVRLVRPLFFTWGTFAASKTNVFLIGGARNHYKLLRFCSAHAPRQAKQKPLFCSCFLSHVPIDGL